MEAIDRLEGLLQEALDGWRTANAKVEELRVAVAEYVAAAVAEREAHRELIAELGREIERLRAEKQRRV